MEFKYFSWQHTSVHARTHTHTHTHTHTRTPTHNIIICLPIPSAHVKSPCQKSHLLISFLKKLVYLCNQWKNYTSVTNFFLFSINLTTGTMRYTANFKAEYTWCDFRIFLLLDWVVVVKLKSQVYISRGRGEEFKLLSRALERS